MWPFKNTPKPTGKVYLAWEHTGWGNRIGVFDWQAHKLEGHTPFYMHVGDEIRFKMGSGQIGRVLISKIEYMRDPSDQFFATFHPVGYL